MRINTTLQTDCTVSNLEPSKNTGFTIVELLVVVVVIGILAAITIVSYSGITAKANTATLQSDLSNAKTQLAIYRAENGSYPTSLDNNKCPLTPKTDTSNCLKSSSGAIFEYSLVSANDFNLRAVKSGQTYIVTSNSGPVDDTTNWITIGAQRWAKANQNVGMMVTGTTDQTNNSTLEKYCYDNDEANCTTYGALYQWNEAMQYVTTEGAQGICPAGTHVPSDNDWKILEVQLGMTQAQADTQHDWRGTDEGTKLKTGGTSGLNIPLAGNRRYSNGLSYYLSSDAFLWSSSESGTTAWFRQFYKDKTNVFRSINPKAYGVSVRCLGN